MKNRVIGAALAAAAALGAGAAVAQTHTAGPDPRYNRPRGRQGQPWRWSAGMAYGTKTRGNLAVRRLATKKRNTARHRAACRG